jgi:hypothetical protein
MEYIQLQQKLIFYRTLSFKVYKIPDQGPMTFRCTGVQLKSGPYFNMSNLFSKIYNTLCYTTNMYLQQVLEMMSIHFNALIDTFHRVPPNFS